MIINIDSDRFVREVIQKSEYSFLFKDLVVVDVGCNVGTFSFWIYKLAREIHAIDMVPENINNLNETIQKNNLGKIKTYCIAIAGSNLPRKYSKDPVLGGGGSVIEDGGGLSTNAMTLRQFMTTHKIEYIDVLKMDIEGLEREVLSASDFPKDRTPTIIGEIHAYRSQGDEKRPGFVARRRIEVRGVLEKMGYRYSEPIKDHFLARKI